MSDSSSSVAGACLLELVFAFFGGGSTYPSSLHKTVCLVILAIRVKGHRSTLKVREKHIRVEEHLILFRKATWWPLQRLGNRRLQSCTNKKNAISIIAMLTQLCYIG
jgi:hypothetical protein